VNVGDVIHGYRVVTEPSSAGAGRCQWSFAEKNGVAYHLKQFLSPKYPELGAPGSERGKARQRERCEAFERRHRAIMRSTRSVSVGGGNLIVATDFFRDGPTYFKVTERIDAIALPEPAELDPKQRAVLLKTLTHSVEILHRHDIVHGDLKPANLLVRSTTGGLYAAKLIDFDDSYFVDDPPPASEIVGDPTHYSPELLSYVKAQPDGDPSTLGTASDMFALGLMFHHLLVGRQPLAAGEDRFPCEVLAQGGELELADELSDAHAELIGKLLAVAPPDRPAAGEVLATLNGMPVPARAAGTARPRPRPDAPSPPPAATSTATGRLRVNFPSRRPAAAARAPEPPRPPDVSPRLHLGPGFKTRPPDPPEE